MVDGIEMARNRVQMFMQRYNEVYLHCIYEYILTQWTDEKIIMNEFITSMLHTYCLY